MAITVTNSLAIPILATSPTNEPNELIVMCDGTGDSPEALDRSRTNVQILREMLGIGLEGQRALYVNNKEGWEIDQFKLPKKNRLIYYDRGLGSPVVNKNGSTLSWSISPARLFSYGYSAVTSVNAQLKAIGISDNIKQAYKFLMMNYKPGDQIYLFGFSRGSYTQRLLVTMVRYIGLLDRTKFANEAEIDKAIKTGFSIYDKNIHPDDNPRVQEFRKNCYDNNELIYFLGLWDTVRGLVAEEVRQDAKIPSVKTARHALAIDEELPIFKPELWLAGEKTDSKQVWFPGVHSDIGGGYKDRDLANVPLQWMIEEAAKVGLKVDPTSVKLFPKVPLAGQHDSLNAPISYKLTWNQVTGKTRRPILQTAQDESLDESVFLRFGKSVKKDTDNIVYTPSIVAHALTAFKNFQKQDPAMMATITIPPAYELDDVGESTNLMPVSSFAPISVK